MNSSPRSVVQPFVKPTSIMFGHTELVEFDYDMIKINRKGIEDITNVRQSEVKHHPDKILITVDNIHEKIPVETVIMNSSPNCIMRNCNQRGVHKLYETIIRDNPGLCDKYNENVIWYKWSSPVEVIEGREFKCPFNKYRHNGSLGTLLNNFYISVHQMSKHLFHYKCKVYSMRS